MEKKTDRRIRKTKKQLRDGLAKLMTQKSINEITVKELVEEVDINRSTFYLHYTDIHDMLEQLENELMNDLVSIITLGEEQIKDIEEGSVHLVKLFTVLDKNRDLCRALSGPHGDISFITKLESYIADSSSEFANKIFKSTNKEDIMYIHSYCISGCVGMVKNWIIEDRKETPEHMAKLTYDMLTNTLKSYISTDF